MINYLIPDSSQIESVPADLTEKQRKLCNDLQASVGDSKQFVLDKLCKKIIITPNCLLGMIAYVQSCSMNALLSFWAFQSRKLSSKHIHICHFFESKSFNNGVESTRKRQVSRPFNELPANAFFSRKFPFRIFSNWIIEFAASQNEELQLSLVVDSLADSLFTTTCAIRFSKIFCWDNYLNTCKLWTVSVIQGIRNGTFWPLRWIE